MTANQDNSNNETANSECNNCLSKKSLLICENCQSTTCKKCTHFLTEDTFKYWMNKPEFLKHSTFCHNCFQTQVADLLTTYENNLELAKEISIFESHQGKETRLIRRLEKPIHVQNAADQYEVFMFLAYQAVLKGYNAVLDVDVKGQKIKINNYQTHIYSGTGVPCNVSDKKLLKDRSLWSNPN